MYDSVADCCSLFLSSIFKSSAISIAISSVSSVVLPARTMIQTSSLDRRSIGTVALTLILEMLAQSISSPTKVRPISFSPPCIRDPLRISLVIAHAQLRMIRLPSHLDYDALFHNCRDQKLHSRTKATRKEVQSIHHASSFLYRTHLRFAQRPIQDTQLVTWR